MNYPVNPPHPGHMQSLSYSVAEVCQLTSLGKTYVYQLINEGKLTARKVGKRTLVTADSVRRLIDQGA